MAIFWFEFINSLRKGLLKGCEQGFLVSLQRLYTLEAMLEQG